MSILATAQADVLADSALADALIALRADRTLWRARVGSEVLAEARRRFARLAIACGVDEADGATFAWTWWTQEMTDAQLSEHRDELWKFTGGAIRKRMMGECSAQTRLSSTRAQRQVTVVGMEAPIRFNSAEELTSINLASLTVNPFEDDEEPDSRSSFQERPIGRRQAISAVNQLLTLAGLTAAQRELVVDELARHVATSVSVRAAADAMHRSPTPAVPIGQERWKALVSLILGTAKGTPGLIELVGQGHPSPMSEPHIRKLLPVFLQKASVVAAGVA